MSILLKSVAQALKFLQLLLRRAFDPFLISLVGLLDKELVCLLIRYLISKYSLQYSVTK